MTRRSLPPLEGDFTRALLRSAEGDEPSSAAYAKAAAALGVGVGLGVTASLPAPAALVGGAAGVAGAARWFSSQAARLAALGVSGALVVGAAGVFLLSGRAPRASGALAQVAQARALPVPHVAPPALVPAPALEATAVLDAAAVAVVVPSASLALGKPAVSGSKVGAAPLSHGLRLPPLSHGLRLSSKAAALSGKPRTGARVQSGSSLAEQVQSLDRARVALGSGDASAALREIAHYRQVWPTGVFLTEASVLEIEALAARGERSLAGARASAFVAAHPDSPQAGRLRALIPQPR